MGHKIGERLVERVSRDTPRFKNELDAVVFICKTFWMHTFNKQVDNLKTNHQVSQQRIGGNHWPRTIKNIFFEAYFFTMHRTLMYCTTTASGC